MPRQLLVALLALVAAPLALLGWVSSTSIRDQRELAQRQLQGLLTSRLTEIDRSLAVVFDDHARRLAAKLDSPDPITQILRTLKLSDPAVRQGILVSPTGVMVYPRKPVADDPDDIALYAALQGMIDGRPGESDRESGDDSLTAAISYERKANLSSNLPATNSSQSSRSSSLGRSVSKTIVETYSSRPQWQVWYMDEGSQLILWVERSDGTSVGLLLERVRWVADMTASLPDSVPSDAGKDLIRSPGFTALVDEAQQIVYRWGDDGECSQTPTSIPLSSPLGSWRLEYHADSTLVPPMQSFGLFASLAGIGVVLLALGGFVLTSVQRQMHAARSRVSFAGQVSHELRTPLTNIRLYAELAESDLKDMPEGESREKLQRRLSVIDTESRRLGRLVSGVLEMVRDDRKQRGPRISSVIPDEVIEQTLAQFAPSFANAGLTVHFDAGAGQSAELDADILEMVLVNLLSNVEKYAAGGKRVDVESRLIDGTLKVIVVDHGPGIPRHRRRSVFRAFTRLDDSINAPSGTGIGLTIARSAANRHGGDLRLLDSDQGTRFELCLPVNQ